jgi:hypothetical protein
VSEPVLRWLGTTSTRAAASSPRPTRNCRGRRGGASSPTIEATRAWDEIGLRHGTNKSSAEHDYLRFYEAILGHLAVERLLELGVYEGASLRTWREIWPQAEIIGVDLNETQDVPGTRIVRANCTDARRMDSPDVAGPFDVIIDDASHMLDEIVASLRIFGPRLGQGGIYIIEDTLVERGTWYPAVTQDVVEAARIQGYQPIVVVPGPHFTHHGDEPIGDLGPWAFVLLTSR